MREVWVEAMKVGGPIVTLIVVLLGTGGVLDRRAKAKEGLTTKASDAQVAVAEDTVQQANPPIGPEWKQLTDAMRDDIARLREELREESEKRRQLSEALTEERSRREETDVKVRLLERRDRVLVRYIEQLRADIEAGLGPPPRAYPAELMEPLNQSVSAVVLVKGQGAPTVSEEESYE